MSAPSRSLISLSNILIKRLGYFSRSFQRWRDVCACMCMCIVIVCACAHLRATCLNIKWSEILCGYRLVSEWNTRVWIPDSTKESFHPVQQLPVAFLYSTHARTRNCATELKKGGENPHATTYFNFCIITLVYWRVLLCALSPSLFSCSSHWAKLTLVKHSVN